MAMIDIIPDVLVEDMRLKVDGSLVAHMPFLLRRPHCPLSTADLSTVRTRVRIPMLPPQCHYPLGDADPSWDRCRSTTICEVLSADLL